jgi:hypothetical protein
MKLEKIVYFQKLDRWDYFSIAIYLFITILIFIDPYNIINRNIVSQYSFLTPLVLYIFNYKSMRKFNVWLIWLVISLFHLWLFQEIKNITKFEFFGVTGANHLSYTWIFVILYQFLRYISLVDQNKELVAPNATGIDIYDGRKVGLIDYICFAIYFGVFLIITNMLD